MLRYQKQNDSANGNTANPGTTFTNVFPILTAAAANGVGTPIDVSGYRYIVLQTSCAASTSLTIKFQCSISNTVPAFGSAQTASNNWDYVGVYDLNDPSTIITGDTGVAFSSVTVADSCRNFYINVDLIKWLNVEVSGYSAGNVTVNMSAAND